MGVSEDANCATHSDGQTVPGAKAEYCGKKQPEVEDFQEVCGAGNLGAYFCHFNTSLEISHGFLQFCPCLFVFSGGG